MIRKLLAVASLAGLVAVAAPVTAQAQAPSDAAVFVFTAGATVADPIKVPVVGPGTATTYKFDTNNQYGPGIGGNQFCVGVGTQGPDTSCSLASWGHVDPGVANLGGWCGYSSGYGSSWGTIAGMTIDPPTDQNGNNTADDEKFDPPVGQQAVAWPQSAGTILPLVLYVEGDGQAGFTAGDSANGSGAVQTTGAEPDTCGVDGPTGTEQFAVTGYASIAV